MTGSATHPSAGNGEVRSRGKKKRWVIAAALAALAVLAVVAVILLVVVPHMQHAKRVEEYGQIVEETNRALVETDAVRYEAELNTVLYALQFDEMGEFQEHLEELSGFTDHYFSEETLAQLADANETVLAVLENDGLTEVEATLVDSAKAEIESEGLMWQTDFLNLDVDALSDVVTPQHIEQVVPLHDSEITEEVLDAAKLRLEQAEADLAAANAELELTELRSAELLEALLIAAQPLADAANAAPGQALVVLDMYPNADAEVVEALVDSADVAADSASAEQFTIDDDYNPVPLLGEPAEDKPYFSVTDSWRATIVARHLVTYTKGITAAWITDAGSVEEALGFNPYAPFIPIG